jgi:uncharacterized protein YjbI with pentapeptide repeats
MGYVAAVNALSTRQAIDRMPRDPRGRHAAASPCFLALAACALAAQLLDASPVAAGEARFCNAKKLVAMGRAHSCLSSMDRKVLAGKPADFARCQDKFERSFSKIDTSGDCAVTGDAGAAWTRVTSRQQPLVGDLLDDYAAAVDPAACAGQFLRAAEKYARCTAQRRAESIKRKVFEIPLYNDSHIAFHEVCDQELDETALYKIWGINLDSDCPPDAAPRERVRDSIRYFAVYMPGVELAGGYLKDVTFAEGEMPGAILSSSEIIACSFEDANLAGASFGGAYLANVSMNRSDVTNVDFSTTELRWVAAGSLVSCPPAVPPGWSCISNHLVGPKMAATDYVLDGLDLAGLDLSEATFEGASLVGANLEGTNLTLAQLSGGDFSNANLTNANLEDVEFVGSILDGANLAGAELDPIIRNYPHHSLYEYRRLSARNLAACPAGLQSPPFTCTNGSILGPSTTMDGMDFTGMDLSDRDFKRASMRGAILVNADLSDSHMHGVDFTDADLTGANVAGAIFYEAVWGNTVCPDATSSNDNGDTCEGH